MARYRSLGLAVERDRDRLAALGGVDHAHRDALGLGQGAQLGALEHRDVQEHVLAAVGHGHEAEALLAVEPLHRAGELDRGRGIGRLARRPRTTMATTAAAETRTRRPAV